MMKYKIAVMMLAFPLRMSVLAKSASATEFKAAPNATRSPNVAANRDRADQNRNRQQLPRQQIAIAPIKTATANSHLDRKKQSALRSDEFGFQVTGNKPLAVGSGFQHTMKFVAKFSSVHLSHQTH